MDLQQWAQAWDVPADQAKAVRYRLATAVRIAFNPSSSVLRHGYLTVIEDRIGTPGAFGLYLLTQMGTDLTPLPEAERLLIVNTSCQHRIELLPGTGEIPALHYYDGRAMYLGCCGYAATAGGQYRRVEGEDIRPEERGRARVAFRAPYGWDHLGLLAVKRPDGEGWCWPADHCHGDRWVTWADLCEIRLARQMGWEVEVLEKLVWPESKPLGLWADRLSRLYLHAAERDPVLARCYRAIALHAIGRLHNVGWREERSVVPVDDPRATFEAVEAIDGQEAHIVERVQFGKIAAYSHPEWSAAIWSVVHRRVAQALLSVPREWVVGVRGDAVYLTHPAPDDGPWQDDGKCGRLRLKGSRSGPLPYPRLWADLTSVIDA